MTPRRASVLIFVLILPSVVLGQRISIDAGVEAGIGSGRFRPTAGAGFVVYDKLSGAVDSRGLILSTGQQTHVRTPYRPDDSSSGLPFVASAGFSWEHSRFRLNPQLRYTRWSGNNTRNQNQWDILLGFTLSIVHRN
jgi:hypothetical protein